MSDDTARLHLPQLISLQELNNVTWNEALAQLDALVDLYLLGQFVDTPPANPADGDAYVIGGAPTGAWTGYAYKIASCLDGAWRFYTPFNGLRAFVASSTTVIIYLNGNWIAVGSTDFATKSGSETLTNKTLGSATLSGTTALPGSGSLSDSGRLGLGTGATSNQFLTVNGGTIAAAYFTSSATVNRIFIDGLANTGFQLANNGVASWEPASYKPAGTYYSFVFYNKQTAGSTSRNALFIHGDTNYVGIGTNSPNAALDVVGSIYPHSDNAFDLGAASYRFGTVYAATGTINTSGRETKANVTALSDAEIAVAKALAANVRVFQFCDAVTKKGAAAARRHTGMIFEDVVAAFAAEGLDPMRYGIVCRDPAVTTVGRARIIADADGVDVAENYETVVPDCDETGAQKWILGLRYNELAQFVIAGLAARIAVLEARL